MFNLHKNEWFQLPSLEHDDLHKACSMVVLGSELFVLGGAAHKPIQVLKDTASFSFETSAVDEWEQENVSSLQWVQKPPMKVSRAFTAAVVYEGCVVVVGGLTDSPEVAAVDSVASFCGESQVWTEMAALGRPHFACGGCVWHDQIVCAGVQPEQVNWNTGGGAGQGVVCARTSVRPFGNSDVTVRSGLPK